MTKLNDADKEELKEHLKAIAKILHKNAPLDKLKTFEAIETTLREQIQEEIAPEIAQFFFQKSVKLKREDLEK
jgi:hypothetical protein